MVPISAPVVPYVPRLDSPESATPMSYDIDSIWPGHSLHHTTLQTASTKGPKITPIHTTKSWRKKQQTKKQHKTKAASADFNEFEELAEGDDGDSAKTKRRKIQEYREKDRIDAPNEPLIFDFKVGASMGKKKQQQQQQQQTEAEKEYYRISVGSVGQPEPAYIHRNGANNANTGGQMKIDPNTVAYMGMSQPYGHQYPSYVSNSMTTLLGTNGGAQVKHLETSEDVVYGKDSSSYVTAAAGGGLGITESEKVSLDALKETIGMTDITDEELIRMIQEMQAEQS